MAVPVSTSFSSLTSCGTECEVKELSRECRNKITSNDLSFELSAKLRRHWRLMSSTERTSSCLCAYQELCTWGSEEAVTFCLCKSVSKTVKVSFGLLCNLFDVLDYACLTIKQKCSYGKALRKRTIPKRSMSSKNGQQNLAAVY